MSSTGQDLVLSVYVTSPLELTITTVLVLQQQIATPNDTLANLNSAQTTTIFHAYLRIIICTEWYLFPERVTYCKVLSTECGAADLVPQMSLCSEVGETKTELSCLRTASGNPSDGTFSSGYKLQRERALMGVCVKQNLCRTDQCFKNIFETRADQVSSQRRSRSCFSHSV